MSSLFLSYFATPPNPFLSRLSIFPHSFLKNYFRADKLSDLVGDLYFYSAYIYQFPVEFVA